MRVGSLGKIDLVVEALEVVCQNYLNMYELFLASLSR